MTFQKNEHGLMLCQTCYQGKAMSQKIWSIVKSNGLTRGIRNGNQETAHETKVSQSVFSVPASYARLNIHCFERHKESKGSFRNTSMMHKRKNTKVSVYTFPTK